MCLLNFYKGMFCKTSPSWSAGFPPSMTRSVNQWYLCIMCCSTHCGRIHYSHFLPCRSGRPHVVPWNFVFNCLGGAALSQKSLGYLETTINPLFLQLSKTLSSLFLVRDRFVWYNTFFKVFFYVKFFSPVNITLNCDSTSQSTYSGMRIFLFILRFKI